MKRFLFYVGTITLTLVLVFASMGIVNYVNKQDNLNNTNIENSVSADIYDLQLEMSSLYLTKSNYETEKAEIEDRLAQLSDDDETTNNEITQLSQRLVVVESEISKLNEQIDLLSSAIEDVYSIINAKETNIATYTYLTDGEVNSATGFRGCPFKVVNQIGDKIIYNADEHGWYLTFDSTEDINILVSFVFTLKSSSTAGNRSVTINTNNTQKLVTVSEYFQASIRSSIVCSPVLLTIPQGQVLRFALDSFYKDDVIYGLGSDGILRTFMTVEVVE